MISPRRRIARAVPSRIRRLASSGRSERAAEGPMASFTCTPSIFGTSSRAWASVTSSPLISTTGTPPQGTCDMDVLMPPSPTDRPLMPARSAMVPAPVCASTPRSLPPGLGVISDEDHCVSSSRRDRPHHAHFGFTLLLISSALERAVFDEQVAHAAVGIIDQHVVAPASKRALASPHWFRRSSAGGSVRNPCRQGKSPSSFHQAADAFHHHGNKYLQG